jgi:hypothetical protein
MRPRDVLQNWIALFNAANADASRTTMCASTMSIDRSEFGKSPEPASVSPNKSLRRSGTHEALGRRRPSLVRAARVELNR